MSGVFPVSKGQNAVPPDYRSDPSRFGRMLLTSDSVRLTGNGTSLGCGWVTDRFGMTWQIVPDRPNELLASLCRDPSN
jgi:hypothetical protein